MTNMGLQYLMHEETKRSNLAREDVNMLNYMLGEKGLSETIRSNSARESENYRSNTARERLSLDSLQETKRSNLVNERLGQGRLDATLEDLRTRYRIQEEQNLRADATTRALAGDRNALDKMLGELRIVAQAYPYYAANEAMGEVDALDLAALGAEQVYDRLSGLLGGLLGGLTKKR